MKRDIWYGDDVKSWKLLNFGYLEIHWKTVSKYML